MKGKLGALDIFVVYLASGSAGKAQRLDSIHKVGEAIKDKNNVLSIVTGDFNFVENMKDRFCNTEESHTRDRDRDEANEVARSWKFKHGLFARANEEYTCRSSMARSRIDRRYSNHHVSD